MTIIAIIGGKAIGPFKVLEICSHPILHFDISSLTDRRDAEAANRLN